MTKLYEWYTSPIVTLSPSYPSRVHLETLLAALCSPNITHLSSADLIICYRSQVIDKLCAWSRESLSPLWKSPSFIHLCVPIQLSYEIFRTSFYLEYRVCGRPWALKLLGQGMPLVNLGIIISTNVIVFAINCISPRYPYLIIHIWMYRLSLL